MVFWGRRFKLELDGSEADAVARRILQNTYSSITDSTKLLLQQEAELRCGTIMVELERFRLKHGRWPRALVDLGLREMRSTTGAPAWWIAPTYTDPYDGQPLRYRRLDDGVAIYSIGPKGWDNDGNLDRTPGSAGADLGFRLWDVAHRRQPPRMDSLP
jgi:hypothetical protein